MLASKGPDLQQITFTNYAEHFKVNLNILNAYLEGGKALVSSLPDLHLESKLKELAQKKAGITRVLDLSSHSGKYSFWSD